MISKNKILILITAIALSGCAGRPRCVQSNSNTTVTRDAISANTNYRGQSCQDETDALKNGSNALAIVAAVVAFSVLFTKFAPSK